MKFLIFLPIKGEVTYEVEADSPEEAEYLVRNGRADSEFPSWYPIYDSRVLHITTTH